MSSDDCQSNGVWKNSCLKSRFWQFAFALQQCLVDGQGYYTEEAGPALLGKNVLKDANETGKMKVTLFLIAKVNIYVLTFSPTGM